jgi:hypothetical protein
MRSTLPLAFAFALLPPRSAADEPVPPPVGADVQVKSTLTNEMSIRFTAAGHLLRAVQQRVVERTDVTIAVVEKLGDALDSESVEQIAKEGRKIETPRARPPFVRLVYEECTASVEHGEHDSSHLPPEYETNESRGRFFIERTTPARAETGRREVRFLYANSGTVLKDVEQRVAIDADAFVAGPRLAPLVLGKPLAADAALDVPPALLEPLLWQAVPEGKVAKATLRPAGPGEGCVGRIAFKIAVVVAWKGGEELPVSATFDLAGDLVVMKDTGQVSALTLAGPIQYSGTSDENGAKLEITGNGKLSFDYTAEPLPKQDGK